MQVVLHAFPKHGIICHSLLETQVDLSEKLLLLHCLRPMTYRVHLQLGDYSTTAALKARYFL